MKIPSCSLSNDNEHPYTDELDERVIDLKEHSYGVKGDLATTSKVVTFFTGTHLRSLFSVNMKIK